MRFDLHGAIDELAAFNDERAGRGITREVYTPTYGRAIDWVAALMSEAGLQTRVDAAGNLLGRWPGAEPDARTVMTGSHVDTTLDAGRFDGVVGVLGAIAAVHLLREEGFAPRRTLELVSFAGEEPRFGTGCVGSRAMAGALSRDDLDRLVDRDGISMAAALQRAGLEPDRIAGARLDPAAVEAFVELHIEQGAVLERSGDEAGVVTAIAAPHDLRLVVRGAPAHAGATPMGMRRDALAGAAEILVELERLARASPSGTTVGTVGVLRLEPGAINVVPGTVQLDVDVRDSDLAAREQTVAGLLDAAGEICARRGLELEVRPIVEDVPVPCAPRVVEAVAAAAGELGVRARRMTSGAYHDAMILGAAGVPVGMLFVPSRDGLSHHPDEHTQATQIDRGVAVLAGALRRLAS